MNGSALFHQVHGDRQIGGVVMSYVGSLAPASFFERRAVHEVRAVGALILLAIGLLPVEAQTRSPDGPDPVTVASTSSSIKRFEHDVTLPAASSVMLLPKESTLPDLSSVALGRTNAGTAVMLTRPKKIPNYEKFNFKAAFWQSFSENFFYHVWRVASDPGMRWNLEHKPFFHDWFASYKGFDMTRWGDGDNFIVNDVGHPLEGAVFARTFLQNSPRSQVTIGNNSQYWMSRLKAMGWSAAWSVQLEIGPVSETSIGNQGGFTYVPGCGTYSSCLDNPKYKKPPTDNTGWTDFIVTPTVGTAWVISEDIIDKYLVTPIAVNHRILGGRVLRSALEPSRSFAAFFAGQLPWTLAPPEGVTASNRSLRLPEAAGNLEAPPLGHLEFGMKFTSISLPVISSTCPGVQCRKTLAGFGSDFGYNFTRAVAFDSSLNFIPEQQGSKAMMEGLFGVRLGERTEHVGVFAKMRPGFIYYQNAHPVQGENSEGSLTRFAADLGGIFEYYPNNKSTWRLDLGTTLVRYLTNHTDPHTYALGSLLSPQYYVTQGNFQLSTGYTLRF